MKYLIKIIFHFFVSGDQALSLSNECPEINVFNFSVDSSNVFLSHLSEIGFRVEAIGKKISLENKDFMNNRSTVLSPTERVLP